ncbi:conserved hypothetical protein [Histoplasma capsulatum H143]|uniref:Chromatin modification-related protein EAF6 n=1 Tax=Ajellomyces capsulatus (strain H143) TaxID=544712 RepID=C6H4M9_AJECH|nr:conserved hypothetical protein [Histoplasma capsulatum H143]
MTENIPPATTAGATGPNGVPATSGSEQVQSRGIPYYEKLRRELRETIQKKRLMDKNMAALEESIYRFEQSYLEETGAGNIIKGFDNYIKGSSGGSGIGFGSSLGSMTGGSGTGGPTTRRKSAVQDADRVFSRSSASFMRVRMSLAINPICLYSCSLSTSPLFLRPTQFTVCPRLTMTPPPPPAQTQPPPTPRHPPPLPCQAFRETTATTATTTLETIKRLPTPSATATTTAIHPPPTP